MPHSGAFALNTETHPPRLPLQSQPGGQATPSDIVTTLWSYQEKK